MDRTLTTAVGTDHQKTRQGKGRAARSSALVTAMLATLSAALLTSCASTETFVTDIPGSSGERCMITVARKGRLVGAGVQLILIDESTRLADADCVFLLTKANSVQFSPPEAIWHHSRGFLLSREAYQALEEKHGAALGAGRIIPLLPPSTINGRQLIRGITLGDRRELEQHSVADDRFRKMSQERRFLPSPTEARNPFQDSDVPPYMLDVTDLTDEEAELLKGFLAEHPFEFVAPGKLIAYLGAGDTVSWTRPAKQCRIVLVNKLAIGPLDSRSMAASQIIDAQAGIDYQFEARYSENGGLVVESVGEHPIAESR